MKAERCRRSLTSFIRHFWQVVEPETPLIWNWHIDVIAEHLEAVTRMQLWNVDKEPRPEKSIDSLIINIPPGHMKSLIVCVFWPAWEWVNHPHLQSIFSSYALALAQRDSMRCRDILRSDQYRNWFKPDWEIREDRDTINVFGNTRGGVRMCIGVSAGTTGFRGHKLVVDDALNAADVTSELKRTTANKWFDRSASTRINDPRKGCKVIIGQRLHEDDITGHALKKGFYEHLCLPSEFVPGETKPPTSIGFEDPRKEHGELLFPGLFSKKVIERTKVELGTQDYEAQHQQAPSPPGGEIFKLWWWGYWQLPGMNLPPVRIEMPDGEVKFVAPITIPTDFQEVIQSWDMTFKNTSNSDFVSGQTWAKHGAKTFLLNRVNARMSFTESVEAVKNLKRSDPRVGLVLIEDKANGPAIISTLKNIVPGIVPVAADISKTARAKAITPFIEAGNTFLPHPDMPGFEWVNALRHQFTSFPTGAHDDDVDAGVHALIRFYRSGTEQKSTSSYRPLPQTSTYIPR